MDRVKESTNLFDQEEDEQPPESKPKLYTEKKCRAAEGLQIDAVQSPDQPPMSSLVGASCRECRELIDAVRYRNGASGGRLGIRKVKVLSCEGTNALPCEGSHVR
ncbi:hypothetical protein ACFX12_010728 [Malus domestica]